MKSDSSIYRVFVVRAWAEKDKRSGEIITRYTLEIPKSGQQSGFVTSQALLEELNKELAMLPVTLSPTESEDRGASE